MKIAVVHEMIAKVDNLTKAVFDGKITPDNDDIANAHMLDEALGHLVSAIELRANRK